MSLPRRGYRKPVCSLRALYSSLAKSLQSCPTLCDPRDGSPPGSTRLHHPWDSPGKSTGVGCYSSLASLTLKEASCHVIRESCARPHVGELGCVSSEAHQQPQRQILSWGTCSPGPKFDWNLQGDLSQSHPAQPLQDSWPIDTGRYYLLFFLPNR